jgi:RNA polymerase sigma-70 factor (ECF subfamily)
VIRIALDSGDREAGAGGPVDLGASPREVDLIDLDRALEELAELDPELVFLVELRYFGGLTIEETAAAMDTSPATVKRGWTAARAWLHGRLDPAG